MTAVSNALVGGRDADGYGCKLECPSVHPGLIAGQLPWASGVDYKTMCLGMREWAAVIVLSRDRGSGAVTLDERGEPALSYPLHSNDAATLQDGLGLATRVLAAAGCTEVLTTQKAVGGTFPLPAGGAEREAAVREMSRRVEAAGVALDNRVQVTCNRTVIALLTPTPNRVQILSAHQMGTARMGSDPSSSVVNPDGESWEVTSTHNSTHQHLYQHINACL